MTQKEVDDLLRKTWQELKETAIEICEYELAALFRDCADSLITPGELRKAVDLILRRKT